MRTPQEIAHAKQEIIALMAQTEPIRKPDNGVEPEIDFHKECRAALDTLDMGDALVFTDAYQQTATEEAESWMESEGPDRRTPAAWLASLNGILVKESL